MFFLTLLTKQIHICTGMLQIALLLYVGSLVRIRPNFHAVRYLLLLLTLKRNKFCRLIRNTTSRAVLNSLTIVQRPENLLRKVFYVLRK